MWQRIRALVTLTLLAQAAGTPPARNCFEFYGFDVLLDDSLKPWLLEVNLSPALASDCEADIVVKQPMLHELFDLLGLPMKHTGLAKLKAPPLPTPTHHSCSSEDENGPSRSTSRARTAAPRTARRGARLRRRRALPLHCVTLQAPGTQPATPAPTTAPSVSQTTAEKPEKTEPEKSREPDSGRYKTNHNDNADTQSASSVSIQSAESVDESWRGGYSTAASRRRVMSACHWGNGVKWNRATGRVGHWVRIYPHSLPAGDELPMEDVRESVAQVTKFVRAAREVSREIGRDTSASAPRDAARDAVFEAALREKLIDFGPHFQVWLPPF